MTETTEIECSCGNTRLEVRGEPILVSECLCDSCRAAAARLATLPDASNILTPYGATPCAEFRKDRVQITSGQDSLKEFRLKPDAPTRRVIATCCNTAIFMETNGAHWLSLYVHLWPAGARPKPELRTMTGDLADTSSLPNDIPNHKNHSVAFYARLFAAWVAMGFRTPKFHVNGELDV